jgi:hypothetical protein
MPMDGSDWLRTQLTSFGCAACGNPYESGRIRLLAERDGLFFVDLGCGHCGTQAVAIVTVAVDEDDTPHIDAGEYGSLIAASERRVDAVQRVSADDVLAMHELLASFQGDVDALLDRLGAESSRDSR